MTRREAREAAFKLAFSKSINKDDLMDIYEVIDESGLELDDFAKEILEKTFTNIELVDSVIGKNLIGWTINRIPRVSLAILRISTAQLLFMNEAIPENVVISEAVEIAKLYGGDDEYSFVNGAMRGILKSIKGEQK